MDLNQPAISVLMAVFNEVDTVKDAVTSIIEQTYPNWEFIIVDDCSNDGTEIILRDLEKSYPEKIKAIRNKTNMGLAASLNKGLEYCQRQYIARMDGDDWSHPQRFEKQIEFMEANAHVDILGTGAYLIWRDGDKHTFLLPETHAEIENVVFKKSIFFHPSVMIRKSFFKKVGNYNEKILRAEDLELWIRGIKSGCRYHNLQEPLIHYRTNGYIRSMKNIWGKFCSQLYIAMKYHYRFKGVSFSFLNLFKSLAIKYKFYTPRSIRS